MENCYIAFGEYEYEGYDVLGVYDNAADACARAEDARSDRGGYDELYAQEVPFGVAVNGIDCSEEHPRWNASGE